MYGIITLYDIIFPDNFHFKLINQEEIGRAGLPVRLCIAGDRFPLPGGVDISAYRIVQEALTNVFRHAGATCVNVTIEPTELSSGAAGTSRSGALVRVRDNGRGLQPDHRLGLGLTGMHERILALGGALVVASDDSGVTVEALVPNDVRT